MRYREPAAAALEHCPQPCIAPRAGGTSLTRKRLNPRTHQRALCIVLLDVARKALFLMSRVPLYPKFREVTGSQRPQRWSTARSPASPPVFVRVSFRSSDCCGGALFSGAVYWLLFFWCGL